MGAWDFVVLQEQSLLPSFSTKRSFLAGAKALTDVIRESDAVPVFYATWGRRDGSKRNVRRNPDYETMQENLTAGYQEAASAVGIDLLIPVGKVWRAVRKADPILGRQLYEDDGAHPSAKGAYLASRTFLHFLFGEKEAPYVGDMLPHEVDVIRHALHHVGEGE